MRTTLKLASAIAALALVFGACGDDDDNPTFDAPVSVDSTPMIDATPGPDAEPAPADLRAGVIAMNELQVANDLSALGLPFGVTVSTVSISFDDLTTEDVPDPAYGEASLGLGFCNVYRYTVGTDEEYASVDEGAVTIASAESADDAGVIGPAITPGAFPACTFVEALGSYNCFAVPPGTAITTGNATANHSLTMAGLLSTIAIDGADFSAATGMVISIDGFAHPVNNGDFSIIGNIGNDTAIVLNTTAAGFVQGGGDINDIDGDTNAADTSYAVTAGASGIVPNGDGTHFEFLDDGSNSITVTKAAGDVVPGFTVMSISNSGTPLTLADASGTLDAFPADDSADWVISCAEADNGDCGNAGGLIVGFALSGSTTDGSLTTGCDGGPCLPIQMPDPVTEYATFTCRGSLGAEDLTLPMDAITEILGTNPTRIETRALRISADLSSDASGVTSVVAGHGIVGWTTPVAN